MKNKVAEYRNKLRYSQKEFAEILEVSRQTVNSIEKGKFNPSLPLAFKICKIFNTRVEDVFFEEEEK